MDFSIVDPLRIVIALGLINVWVLRFNKSTSYRGAAAESLPEEFAAYGLPSWFFYLVGFLKISSAIALLLSFLYPYFLLPATAVVLILMIGAVAMHVKVADPLQKSLPAAAMLTMCAVIVICSL